MRISDWSSDVCSSDLLANRDKAYAQPLLDLGRAKQWRMGDLPFHADDQLIGQAWLWAAQNGEGKKAIAPIRAYFDHVLAHRPTIGLEFIPVAPGKGTSTYTDRWCWFDAFFMAPPTILRLAPPPGARRSTPF